MKLTGNEDLDLAGRYVDVADLDGDGMAELLVAEPREGGTTGSEGPKSAVHLIEEPGLEDGRMMDAATVTVVGASATGALGGHVALFPEVQQVSFGGASKVLQTFSLPEDGVYGGQIPVEAATGFLDTTSESSGWGLGQAVTSGVVSTGAQGLWLSGAHASDEGPGDWAGIVVLHELPLVGIRPAHEHRARYDGDPVDHVREVLNADLDGDGLPDLVVGAWARNGTGVVGLIVGPPDGHHRVWDVADATLSGEAYGGHFGKALASGDLDGDGHVDIGVGIPIGDGGAAVFAGPFSGDETVADAEWRVEGLGSWVGYSLVVADLSGDGAGDLAVGAPEPFVNPDALPGAVLLYNAPSPGIHRVVDADRTLTGDRADGDGFGAALAAGDMDGDGDADLVVGAPTDRDAGFEAGAAWVFWGGPF